MYVKMYLVGKTAESQKPENRDSIAVRLDNKRVNECNLESTLNCVHALRSSIIVSKYVNVSETTYAEKQKYRHDE